MAVSQGPFRGSFVSTGEAVTVAVPSGVDYIRFINRTNWSDNDVASVRVVGGHYYANMAAGTALLERKIINDNTLEAVDITTLGFTLIDDAAPASFAAVALANPAFTQADPAVWESSGVHGLSLGDIVRVTSTTAALQYGGLLLSATVIGDTTHFTSLLDGTGITQATAGNVRKIASAGLYFPQNRQIAAVTVGTTTVIRMTVAHSYTVGDIVSFRVPSAYSMTELNDLKGTITAIDTTITTNTITVDIDSSAFTAFSFPTSANFQTEFAQVIPVGEIASNVDNPSENRGVIGIEFGSGVAGAASDIIDFWCFYGGQVL